MAPTAPGVLKHVMVFATKRQVFALLASRHGRDSSVQMVRAAALVDFSGLKLRIFKLHSCFFALSSFYNLLHIFLHLFS